MPQQFYACKAASAGGRVRCRVERGKCSNHHEELKNAWVPAPRPTVVLLKINCNEKWEKRFESAGVKRQVRSLQRSVELGQKHVAQAHELGRNPYAVRRVGQPDDWAPESADSGTPVFGKDGLLGGTDIHRMLEDLGKAGYVLTNAHLLERGHKPPMRLVMELTLGATKAIEFPWQLFHQLVNTTFGKIDVWANPQEPDGRVTHTVNCGQRDTQMRKYYLRFAGGDWDLDEVPIEEAVPETAGK